MAALFQLAAVERLLGVASGASLSESQNYPRALEWRRDLQQFDVVRLYAVLFKPRKQLGFAFGPGSRQVYHRQFVSSWGRSGSLRRGEPNGLAELVGHRAAARSAPAAGASAMPFAPAGLERACARRGAWPACVVRLGIIGLLPGGALELGSIGSQRREFGLQSDGPGTFSAQFGTEAPDLDVCR